MKVTVQDINPVQKRLSVEIAPDEVAKELDKAYGRLKKHAKVKGFRKGKAPRHVLENQYGSEVQAEVAEKLIQDSIPRALEEADVVLILQPQLDNASDIRQNEPFTYSAVLDLWPKFDVPEYTGIELVKPLTEVTDEEIKQQLEALGRHYAKLESVDEDRPVREGDIAIVDYAGAVDGEAEDGLTEENYYLEVGAGHFNEQFEKGLVGMTKGDEKTIKVSYPDDALNAKVAGKTVSYAVTLKEIKERVLPELSDEFAREIGAGFTTLEELTGRLREQIEKDKEEAAQRSLRDQLIDKLCERVDFPIPERLVEQKLIQMVDNVAGHLQERGLDLGRAGITEERLQEKMRDDAKGQVKVELILDKIADAEDISVPNDELSEYIDKSYRDLDVDRNQLEAAVTQHVLPKLRARKTVDFLLEKATITAASAEEEEKS